MSCTEGTLWGPCFEGAITPQVVQQAKLKRQEGDRTWAMQKRLAKGGSVPQECGCVPSLAGGEQVDCSIYMLVMAGDAEPFVVGRHNG